jgi:hypothetical protein
MGKETRATMLALPAQRPGTEPQRSARHPADLVRDVTTGRFGSVEAAILWIERFDTLEQLRAAVRAFGRRYHAQWLIE